MGIWRLNSSIACLVPVATLAAVGVGCVHKQAGVVQPCGGGQCVSRDVGQLQLFEQVSGGAAYGHRDTGTVEEILEKGLSLAGASPVHLVIRGTPQRGSFRCHWRGIARTRDQRNQAVRF